MTFSSDPDPGDGVAIGPVGDCTGGEVGVGDSLETDDADAAGSSGDSVAVPHPATTTASPTAEARGRRGTRRIPQSSVTTDGASTGGDVRMMRFPVSLGTL